MNRNLEESLDVIRKDFEKKGYRFVFNPSSSELPIFLQHYRPDAVAIKENDKIIIEINALRDEKKRKIPVSALAKQIPPDSEWRYLLVNVGHNPNHVMDLPRLKKTEIDAALQEIKQLVALNLTRPAMLELWSLFEALSRRIYPSDIRFSLRPLSPIQIVERLAMEGDLDKIEAQKMRELISVRNSLAHGNLGIQVGKKDIDFMIILAEKINDRIGV